MQRDMPAEKSEPLFPPEGHPRDEGTFPHSDLNPMTNPTLGRNLGKWAQVYVTTPPEKREHAVGELLRELQGTFDEGSREPSLDLTLPGGSAIANNASPTQIVPKAGLNGTGIECSGCGRTNASDQWFCGYCGAELRGLAKAVDSRIGGALHSGNTERTRMQQSPSSRMSEAQQNDLEWLRERTLSGLSSHNKKSHPIRTVFMLILMAGISAFVYIQWQNAGAKSPAIGPAQNVHSREISSASASSSETVDRAKATTIAKQPLSDSAGNNAAGEKVPKRSADTEFSQTPSKTAPPDKGDTPENEGSGVLSGDSGDRELAIAETFLKGGSSARDSREAAKWLWKSVAKHNSTALVQLADLYAHGDGVGKNCDQAQILLVAAAKKGSFEAGQRLRNLQTHGCK